MRLIFIRHAEPDYEHDCLTAKGRREAELLSRRTARWENIAGIYVSPLGRARETASYTLRALKKEAVTLPWLREFSYSVRDPENGVSNVPWDFLPEYYTRIPQMYDKEEWLHTDIFRSNPEIEPAYTEVCSGFDGILEQHGYFREGNMYLRDPELTGPDDEKNLLFFCHFGVTSIILSHLIGASAAILLENFIMMPSAVTAAIAEKRTDNGAYFRIQFYGDTSHLTGGGEPVSNAGAFSTVFQG